MARQSPARAAIAAAIDLVEKHGLPLTPATVRANVDIEALSLADAREALAKHVNGQIPLMLKERGCVIVDERSGERKSFWTSTPDELEEQERIKARSSDFDRVRLACGAAVVAFLREKEREFGYEVCPDLFADDIARIYAMHSVPVPARMAEAA